MTPTTIPAERSLTYIFTTFANVARHASSTRCSGEMSSLSLICYSLSLSDSWVPQLISLPYGTHTSALSPMVTARPSLEPPSPHRVTRTHAAGRGSSTGDACCAGRALRSNLCLCISAWLANDVVGGCAPSTLSLCVGAL